MTGYNNPSVGSVLLSKNEWLVVIKKPVFMEPAFIDWYG